MTRRWAVLAGNLCVGLVLLAAVPPAPAQGGEIAVAGQILDSAKQPAVGYRVVLRVKGGAEVYLSTPADASGNYEVSVPAERTYVVVAVLSPDGGRTALDGLPEFTPQPGLRSDVALPFLVARVVGNWPATFAGGDRLYLAYVEDAVIVRSWDFDATVEHDDFDSGSTDDLDLVGAVSFESIPRVEFGARLAFVDEESESGLGDTDAWVKLDLGQQIWQRTRVAVGGLVTLPTGDSDTGLGTDAFGSKLFGAMRFAAAPFLVSAHVGVRFTGDGEVAGTPLDGTTSVDAGLAAIWPLNDRLAWIGETSYEGERFEGTEADARLLFGANWKPIDFGSARIAAGAGLTDGAPDWLVIVGWSFEP